MRNLKPLAALALTAASSALVVGFQVPDAGAAAADTSASTTDASSATVSGAGSSSDSGATTDTGTGSTSDIPATTDGTASGSETAATGQFADGTYLGAAVAEPWGAFQVQAVVSGGQLVDVTIVSAPTDRHSSRINNSSIPTLTSRALASQSADVDVISGATWTSESYATSLQAALDAAETMLDEAA